MSPRRPAAGHGWCATDSARARFVQVLSLVIMLRVTLILGVILAQSVSGAVDVFTVLAIKCIIEAHSHCNVIVHMRVFGAVIAFVIAQTQVQV